MNDKAKIVNGLYRTAGFIDALVSEGYEEGYIDYLRAAADFINNQPSHEEYKAAWLNVINTLHANDPLWHENYAGDSEWQKVVALVNDLYRQLRIAESTIANQQQDIASLECASRNDSEIIRELYERQASLAKMYEPAPLRTWIPTPDAVVQEVVAQILEELGDTGFVLVPPTSIATLSVILEDNAARLRRKVNDCHCQNHALEEVRHKATRIGAIAIQLLSSLPYVKPAEHDVNAGWAMPIHPNRNQK